MNWTDRLRPARGVALAALAAATVWALIPAEDASTLLRVSIVTLLSACAVAALAASAIEDKDER